MNRDKKKRQKEETERRDKEKRQREEKRQTEDEARIDERGKGLGGEEEGASSRGVMDITMASGTVTYPIEFKNDI